MMGTAAAALPHVPAVVRFQLFRGTHLMGIPLPTHSPAAGTVSCPSCLGSPKVHRITPDFAKVCLRGCC